MVKLIRLLGDSEQNATEIRNTFRQSIMVKPNAKVALVGASAYLTDDVANELFKIYDDNTKYFKVGETDHIRDCAMTAGSYTGYELIEEFATAANYCGTVNEGIGMHHQTHIQSNVFVLDTYKALYAIPDFTQPDQWEFENMVTLAPGTATGPVASYGTLTSDVPTSTVPMVHNKFGVTLQDISGQNVFSCYDSYEGYYLFGFEVSGGTYYKVINDVHTSLATSWAANDVVTMETYAGGYHLTIKSSTGVLKKQEDQLLALPRAWYGPTKQGGYKWFIEMRNSSVITNCLTTTLYGAGGIQTVKDVTVNCVLQFKTPDNKTNIVLGQYLGFGNEGGAAMTYSGNPASIGGRSQLKGLPAYPGIMVVIDGLGPLQSYDGAGTSRAPDNIIYVLNDLTNVSSNLLQIDIPAPFYLDLNNANPININELRARFLPATGQKDNPSLSFSGKPSLTLLIDG